jgi:pimeloyl-ACP methyl ester carboxylesterase
VRAGERNEELEMPEIAVDGGALYYEEHGSGTPLLLIHGTGADAAVWGEAVGLLATGARVIAYDRRGHSRSVGPPAAAYARDAEDAATLLRGLGAAPAVVLGWSVGGLIALELALAHPEIVRALVLVEPPLHAKRSFNPPLVAMVVRAQLLRRLRGERAAARAFLEWAYRTRSRTGEFSTFSTAVQQASLANAAAIMADLDAGTGEELTAQRLAGIRCPVTCMVAADTQPRLAARTLRIPRLIAHARMERIEGAGHASFRDQPKRFADAVLEAVSASEHDPAITAGRT